MAAYKVIGHAEIECPVPTAGKEIDIKRQLRRPNLVIPGRPAWAALPRLAPTRDQPAAGGHHGRCGTRPWPVAAQPASRRPGRLARDLLRRAWPANPGAGRRMTPPPNRRGRTRTHGGVGGVEPR